MYNDERYKEEEQTETHRLVNSRQNNASRLFANKLVLSFSLAKGEFSVGGEYSHSRRKNLYSVLPTGVVDAENNRIKENIASVFMDYSKQFGKVGLQVGLRYERVGFNYYERDVLVHAQSKRYADWFPSLTLSFPVHAVQMQLSYSSDINRPSFSSTIVLPTNRAIPSCSPPSVATLVMPSPGSGFRFLPCLHAFPTKHVTSCSTTKATRQRPYFAQKTCPPTIRCKPLYRLVLRGVYGIPRSKRCSTSSGLRCKHIKAAA